MKEIKILADKILTNLKKDRGLEADVYCEHSRSWEVEIRKNQLENFSNEDVYGYGVRVIDNGRVGIAFSSELIEDSIYNTIEKAKRNAINSTFDRYNGLPTVEMGNNDIVDRIKRDIWDEELENIPRKDKIDKILDLSYRAVALDKRIREGLEKEVRDLLRKGISWDKQSMTSLGYRQWADYIKGRKAKKIVVEKSMRQEFCS